MEPASTPNQTRSPFDRILSTKAVAPSSDTGASEAEIAAALNI